MTKIVAANTLSALAKLPSSWVMDRRGRTEKVLPDNALAVTYSRFSTDKQKEISIERQIESCQLYADHTRRRILRHYADRAKSGARTVGRFQLEEMLLAAARGEFGIVIIENVDRLARDLSILSAVFKKLQGMGIEMHQAGRGRLHLPDIAMQGLMGDEGRRVLLERTQFARDHMARQGLVPSGKCYGYDAVPGMPGHVVLNQAQAGVVKRIYSLRAEGLSPRSIAFSLNANPAADRVWTSAAIETVLRNPRYNGFVVYKQHEHSRDENGKRCVSLRPPEEWIVTEAPNLRIVEARLWERAQDLRELNQRKDYSRTSRNYSYLLSGKVYCPVCNKPMRVRDGGGRVRFACSTYRDKNKCKYTHTFYVAEIERLALSLIEDNLFKPGYISAYVEAYNSELKQADGGHEAVRAELERRIRDAKRRLDATVDEALMVGFSPDDIIDIRISKSEELRIAQEALAKVPRIRSYAALDEHRLTTLRDAIGGLKRSLPFRPKDEASFRLMASFSELIERVDPVFIDFGKFDATFSLSVESFILDGNLVGQDGSGKVRLVASHRWHRNAYSDSEKAKADAIKLESGYYSITNDDWDAVKDYVPADILRSANGNSVDARCLVNALVFRCLANAPWAGLPPSFGDWKTVMRAGNRLNYHGKWNLVREELHRRNPKRYELVLRNLGNLRPLKANLR